MSAHTSGPWLAHREKHGLFVSAGSLCIAQLGDGFHPQAEANASLIAVAPELLDALAEATGLLQGVVEAMDEAYPKTCSTLVEHSTRFLALLVKATGA